MWPGVRLCYSCIRDSITFLVTNTRIIDGNPFLIELASGVWPTREFNGDEYIDAHYETPNRINTFSNIHIRLRAESRTEVENPLDILSGL